MPKKARQKPETTVTRATIEALPYRPCVGITLFNADGLVFVGHRARSEEDRHWQMPQGGIDDGEEPHQAAFRELQEETGTAKARILGETRDWLTYDIPFEIARRSFKARYRGQRQKWFAMRFEGADADFDLATHTQEFDEWQWVPLEDVVNLIIPFKRSVYEQVVAEFRAFAVPE